jgi:AcrR family transcriptional regulator
MNTRTTREHIVEAADRLFYEKGYDHTSFADIARDVNISRGNFYHHFKSKDEILDAVIQRRLGSTRAMLAEWEKAGETPMDRIRSFINILVTNRVMIRRFGCPVGTLCTELSKLNHGSQEEANQLFNLFRIWLRKEFIRLGREGDADDLAMHLLARSQGVAILAHAFDDDAFIDREVASMLGWLTSCLGHG